MLIISDIKKQISDGLVTIEKINDAFKLTKKQFDVDTGVEIDPIIETISVDAIEKSKVSSLKIAASCDELLEVLKTIK